MTTALRVGVAVVVVVALGLATTTGALPTDLGVDAPRHLFAAGRAQPILDHLAGTIGERPAGSAQLEVARRFLEESLRQLARIELQRQDATGTIPPDADFSGLVVYHANNLLVRIPGRTREAIVVSVHYDSAVGSPGAADNGVAVAAAVELVRALAEGPALECSIVFLFDGAEEVGLAGARAFLKHPWAEDIRAFINLDAAGAGGRATLFRVVGGDLRLVEAYADVVDMPSATVVGEDLFATGLVPSATSFGVFAERGWPGVDLALFRDGYRYHSSRDTVDGIAPGTLQHVGDSVLALIRRLARMQWRDSERTKAAIYYDILGLVTICYEATTAVLLALAVCALMGAAAVLTVRRVRIGPRVITRAVWANLAGAILAVIVAAIASSIPTLLAGRGLGWFARPWLGATTAVAAGAVGLIVGDRLAGGARSVDGVEQLRVHVVADGIVAAVLSTALALAGFGIAYIPLWFAAPAAIAVALASFAPARAAAPVLLLGVVPGLVVTAQLGDLLLAFIAPLAGRLIVPVPVDTVFATTTALVAIPFLRLVIAVMPRGRTTRLALIGSCATALAGLAAVTLAPPFTHERPKRLLVQQRIEPSGNTLLVRAFEDAELEDVAAIIGPPATVQPAARRSWPGPILVAASDVARGAVMVPSVTAAPWRADLGSRQVTVEVPTTDVHRLQLTIPCDSVRTWSATLPCPTGATPTLLVLAPPPNSWRLEIELTTPAPVTVEVTRIERAPLAAREFAQRLPAWVSVTFEWVETTELRL